MNRKKLMQIFEKVKESERENLDKLPSSVAISIQSGWLLGYADAWNKLRNAILVGKNKEK